MPQEFFAAYINLDRAPGRRLFMERQLGAAGIKAERIAAVDRSAPGFTPRGGLKVQRDDVLIEMNWDGRPYVTGEEACLQSHVVALKRFLESGAPHAVIFEDDAELAPDFLAVVEAALARRELWDAVKLEGNRKKGGRPALAVAPLTGPYRLVASMNPAAGTAAYLFSRAGAERVLARLEGVFEPYDNFLATLWRHDLRLLDCAPFPARQGIAESSRSDTRARRQRSAAEAFTRWHRHVRADFIGRNLRRWPAQLRHYLKLAKGLTIAPWARAWPAPPAPAPTVTSPPG